MLQPAELDRLCVVLVRPRNPLNLGAAARAMSNFGFSQLRVVNPYAVAFREARSAVGAAAVLTQAREYQTVAEAVADCTLVVGTTAIRIRELRHPMRRLESGAKLLRKRLASHRAALLFGSEKTGLSNDDLSYCHWLLNIPTRKEHISMNLGQAVAICLYELMRDGKAHAPAEKRPPAAAVTVERITTVLHEALDASGYLKPGAAPSTAEKTRRMLRRFHLEADDAEVFLGMLKRILWKLRSE